jgi:hypothetical protein
MSFYGRNLIWAAVSLIAGTLFLLNVDRIARFDQDCGTKLKAWRHRKFGNSVLNRELWPVGTPQGHASSRLVVCIAGVVLLLTGIARMVLAFRVHYFR